MSPEDKAKELIEKMDIIHHVKLGGKNSESKGLPVSMYKDQIKQCALICVDEILEITFPIKIIESESFSQEYWELVKQEIQKL